MPRKRETTTEQPPDTGYTVGQWKTLPHYTCTRCRFDTLDLAAMERHVAEQHTPRVVQVPVAELRDRFGNPLTREVIVHGEG